MFNKLIELPNHCPNFASGLCNALCFLSMLLTYLIIEALGFEIPFGMLVGSTIFSQLIAIAVHVQWVNIAEQRQER